MSRHKPVVDSNPVNFVPRHAKYFCGANAGRSNILAERNTNLPVGPPVVPIIENQGFFRLSDPRKQKKPDIAVPMPYALKIPLSSNSNPCTENLRPASKSPNSPKNQKYVFSPQFAKCEPTPPPAMVSPPPAFNENSKAMAELKTRLNDKEIEVLDLRNEKMRLEMIAESQRKEMREKAKDLENMRRLLEEYKDKLTLDPTNEEYNSRIQKILKIQQETHADAIIKLKEKYMRDYEKLARDKNEEIKGLQQRINELQRINKTSIENEVKRLGSLLSEADAKLKEKNKEIVNLQNEIERLSDENYDAKGALYSNALEAENAELRQKLAAMEEKYRHATIKKEPREEEKESKPLPEAEMNKKMQKELSAAYKDIMNLSKAISGILKGEEPNMQSLWGVAHTEKDSVEAEMDELSLEDLGNLKMAIDTIRTNICDYYAEKYSNECNLQ